MLKNLRKAPLYTTRVIIAFISITFFISIFFIPYPFLIKNIYFFTNPFLAITFTLTTRTFNFLFLFSIITIFLTLFFGRFYCSFICPWGITLDIISNIFGYREVSKLKRIKGIILSISLLLAIFALPFSYAGDPILFLYWLYGDFILNKNMIAGFIIRYHFFLIVLIFQIVFLIYARRFYCTHLCPLGGIYSIIAKFSFFKRKVDKKCNYCNLCVENCRMGAIASDPELYNPGECSLCGYCEKICPQNSIRFNFFDFENFSEKKVDRKRREVIKDKLPFLIPLLFIRIKNKKTIRPPGSVSEDKFVLKCIRCAECIRVCPTGVLEPLYFENGILSFYTPYVNTKKSYCKPDCNLCSKVCPTGAIKPFEIKDKIKLKIGIAKIDKGICYAFNKKPCFLCVVKCPYYAIALDFRYNPSRPFVIDKRCPGCGICENVCPTEPVAIKVFAL